MDTQKKLLLPESRKSNKGLLKGLMLKSNLSTQGGRQGGRAFQMEGTARQRPGGLTVTCGSELLGRRVKVVVEKRLVVSRGWALRLWDQASEGCP